ncbi:hypothetical protein JCGZ_02997 [Jatropha curcas]|uniref:Aminotransferase-like plant mobile domain-containing protein n=1 Tax=Jatropha curcas TaxID=180498 RepID=A0A067JGV9_JATCU|nr:hypothetical protein JCGZ_02997 [Jatropha curcas]
MRARVVAAGFGDYAAGLRRTQPRFSPAMRYALMERWNDCTHTFIFMFGEMTLTPVDYATITGLRFTGPIPPLDARGESNLLFIQPLELWSYEYCIYPGGPSCDSPVESRRIPRYLAHCHHTYAISEDLEYWRSFLNDRELSDLFLTPWDCDAWRIYLGGEVAGLHTRSSLLMRGYWADRYFLGERIFDTPIAPAQRRRYQEICQRFGFARSYIGRLYSDVHERTEVELLRTSLEVEGIPLDSSEEGEDGSSSDDAPLSPPPAAAAGPSRRQR